MFGKGKLLKHGEQANAVVVDADMSGTSNSHGAYKWHLQLRVQFDDGTTGDVKCSAYEVSVGTGYGAGQIVPVRYDAGDRSKVAVDVDALGAVRDAHKAAAKAKLVEMAEERLAKGEGPPEI